MTVDPRIYSLGLSATQERVYMQAISTFLHISRKKVANALDELLMRRLIKKIGGEQYTQS